MIAPRRIQRFEVIDHLGSGGMGSVFRARDPQLERDVAMKLLLGASPPGELSLSETIDLRSDVALGSEDLLREARMMARLSHPNVLSVYEVGLSGGAVFLVMEHIDGTDLSGWLARPRSTEAILDVFRQAAQGLLAAHQQGIVHRDIASARCASAGSGRACARPCAAGWRSIRPFARARRIRKILAGTGHLTARADVEGLLSRRSRRSRRW